MEYFYSTAYGEWCERVFGIDLKQAGMITNEELQLLYSKVLLPPDSNILDICCGAGYITATVAEHYKSHATGIDIHEGSIKHAKKVFSNNTALNYKVLDVKDIAYEAESFDLICFFDSLYLESVRKVRSLMDKCVHMLKPNGKIIVFWTNQPANTPYGYLEIFEMPEPSANNTQVALWGIEKQIEFKAFELTKDHRIFWIKGRNALKDMETELNNEMPEEYKLLLHEYINNADSCEKGDAGGFFRWIYIFHKK
jgi:cyclopropane fatty-acyl-phospholipid synthase-like methyltransferase